MIRQGTARGVWIIDAELYRKIPNRDQIVIMEGSSVMDLTELEFELQFRCSPRSDSAELILNTDSGLIITTSLNDDGDSIDVVQLNDVYMSSLSEGEYLTDLIMKDVAGDYTFLAQGVTQVINSPVTPTI